MVHKLFFGDTMIIKLLILEILRFKMSNKEYNKVKKQILINEIHNIDVESKNTILNKENAIKVV